MTIKGRRYRNRQQFHTYLDLAGEKRINDLADSLGASASSVLAAGLGSLMLAYTEMIISQGNPDIKMTDVITHQRSEIVRLDALLGNTDVG